MPPHFRTVHTEDYTRKDHLIAGFTSSVRVTLVVRAVVPACYAPTADDLEDTIDLTDEIRALVAKSRVTEGVLPGQRYSRWLL